MRTPVPTTAAHSGEVHIAWQGTYPDVGTLHERVSVWFRVGTEHWCGGCKNECGRREDGRSEFNDVGESGGDLAD